MKEPKITSSEKSATKAKAGQPVATVVPEVKPKKPTTLKSTHSPKAVMTKSAANAKTGQPAAPAAATKPKKASATQKGPKKAKAVVSKAKATSAKKATPERADLSADNIWPNWFEKLLGNFEKKKK